MASQLGYQLMLNFLAETQTTHGSQGFHHGYTNNTTTLTKVGVVVIYAVNSRGHSSKTKCVAAGESVTFLQSTLIVLRPLFVLVQWPTMQMHDLLQVLYGTQI